MKKIEKEHPIWRRSVAPHVFSAMKFFLLPALFYCFSPFLARADSAGIVLSEIQQKFRAALTAKYQSAERQNAGAVVGENDWLFLIAELRFLATEKFWGQAAAKVGRSRKPQWADPIPAIVDFQRRLKERDIELLLVPVPPKAAIYPEKIFPEIDLRGAACTPFLDRFYEELRAEGVKVVDLTKSFVDHRDRKAGAIFCRTDSHWSGVGCALAAQAIAEEIRSKFSDLSPRTVYTAEWKKISVDGDLRGLLAQAQQPPPEEIFVRTVSEKTGGTAVSKNADSPLLLLGDSHVLVFHDFFGERAGLLDQLAFELGFAADLIGTRGSGATPVRINLYRRSLNDPDYLAKKKVVLWCFAAREFTEAEQGWVPQPLAK